MLFRKSVAILFMLTTYDTETLMDYDENCDLDDAYTYPIAGEGEEVQWDLMAKHGVITQEQADYHKACDALPVTRVEVLVVDYSCVRRLLHTRLWSSVARTLGEKPLIPARGHSRLGRALISYGRGIRETRNHRNSADVVAIS
jgi:hypothetical protein